MATDSIATILNNSDKFLKGKRNCFELSLCAILSGSNALIEDSPGVGKTTMVKYLARTLGLKFGRVQFTNDLLPADIVGTSIYNKESGQFQFHSGPIFGELILADELNRAPPKTQSALLEAMEEKSITVDGVTHWLPEVFTVFATQNPMGQIGTHPLPESQLDRFAIKFEIGFLNEEATVDLLKAGTVEQKFQSMDPLLDASTLQQIQSQISQIHVEDDLYRFIYRLLECSRQSTEFLPLSNRCALDLVKLARAKAYLLDRDYILPDDLVTLFPFVAGHRLTSQSFQGVTSEHASAYKILEQVPIR